MKSDSHSMLQSALILVDIQNDFLPGGALAVPEGDAVIAVANELMNHFPLVVSTQDWHPPHHESFASQHPGSEIGQQIDLHGLPQILWPDHCIQGTPGAEFAPELETGNVNAVFQKGTDSTIDSYSGFFDNGHRKATGLHEYLQEQKIKNVYLLGLATDYCVKYTALDAVELGYQTHLIEEGCRAVNLSANDAELALAEMRDAGVHILHSSELINHDQTFSEFRNHTPEDE